MTSDPDEAWAEIDRQMAERMAEDPFWAEELTAFRESADYVIRPYDDGGDPIRCEMCGTGVRVVQEAEVLVLPWDFRPGIWESGFPFKHTLRRCNWLREHKS